MEREVIKIGSVEMYKDEALKLYQEQKYIMTYSKIYQLHYSNASQMVYGQEIYYQPRLALRGRYHTMTAKAVNHILGFNLLNE